MKIDGLATDSAILVELGTRLTQRRLELELTQEAVAEQAGVAKRTLERIEAGASTQLSTLIRIMRVLELLDLLDRLFPETGPRPMDLLKLKGKLRKRAPRGHKTTNSAPWQWRDDA